jgi:hypothetical protein
MDLELIGAADDRAIVVIVGHIRTILQERVTFNVVSLVLIPTRQVASLRSCRCAFPFEMIQHETNLYSANIAHSLKSPIAPKGSKVNSLSGPSATRPRRHRHNGRLTSVGGLHKQGLNSIGPRRARAGRRRSLGAEQFERFLG